MLTNASQLSLLQQTPLLQQPLRPEAQDLLTQPREAESLGRSSGRDPNEASAGGRIKRANFAEDLRKKRESAQSTKDQVSNQAEDRKNTSGKSFDAEKSQRGSPAENPADRVEGDVISSTPAEDLAIESAVADAVDSEEVQASDATSEGVVRAPRASPTDGADQASATTVVGDVQATTPLVPDSRSTALDERTDDGAVEEGAEPESGTAVVLRSRTDEAGVTQTESGSAESASQSRRRGDESPSAEGPQPEPQTRRKAEGEVLRGDPERAARVSARGAEDATSTSQDAQTRQALAEQAKSGWAFASDPKTAQASASSRAISVESRSKPASIRGDEAPSPAGAGQPQVAPQQAAPLAFESVARTSVWPQEGAVAAVTPTPKVAVTNVPGIAAATSTLTGFSVDRSRWAAGAVSSPTTMKGFSTEPVRSEPSLAIGGISNVPGTAAIAGKSQGASLDLNTGTGHRAGSTTFSADSAEVERVFAAQVERGVLAAASSPTGTVTLRLHPAALGLLRVQVSLERGAVAAKFEASSVRARDALHRGVAGLKSSLAERGIELTDVSVSVAPAWPARGIALPPLPVPERPMLDGRTLASDVSAGGDLDGTAFAEISPEASAFGGPARDLRSHSVLVDAIG